MTRGFDSALGTYLIRCDDDLDVPPTFVAQHVMALAGRKDLVVLSPTRGIFPTSSGPSSRWDTAVRRPARRPVPRAFVSGASRRLFADVHPDAARPVARPSGMKGLVWQRLANALSITVRTRRGYASLGRTADRILPHVGTTSGRLLVALLVEAAGQSGRLHGTTDLHSFQIQKADELTGEIALSRCRT